MKLKSDEMGEWKLMNWVFFKKKNCNNQNYF